MNKRCKKCNNIKPLSDFYKNKSYSDGYASSCKKCILEYEKQYQAAHKKEISKKHKRYYQKNKEKMTERSKEYYQRNKDRILEKAVGYRASHREELKTYFKKRYTKNKNKILANQKEYTEKHREEKIEYLKKYYKENKDKLLAQSLRRQRHRLAIDPSYRLKRQARLLVWRSFHVHGENKPAHTEQVLGCSLATFSKYLRLTWKDRYGTEWNGQPCHIDHIVPLATARTREDITKLCRYTNLQLLTPEDNLAKGARMAAKTLNNKQDFVEEL